MIHSEPTQKNTFPPILGLLDFLTDTPLTRKFAPRNFSALKIFSKLLDLEVLLNLNINLIFFYFILRL